MHQNHHKQNYYQQPNQSHSQHRYQKHCPDYWQFATARYETPINIDPVRLLKKQKVAIIIILIVAAGAMSSAIAKEMIVTSMSEIESGSLLFLSDERNHYLRAPLLDTSVRIGVQGLLARTVVEQQFTNDSSDWMEGIYAFPLPDNATVDELTMSIGESVIEGVIQTRSKARNTYENAKATGKKASLLEQQRPNLFTTRVTNIPPGESVTIKIGYQSAVRYVDGQFSLYFPLTITPRYIPARILTYDSHDLTASSDITGSNAAAWTTLRQVQDSAAITPPQTHIAAPASITVTLDTGLAGLIIDSTTHDIISTKLDTPEIEKWNVSLAKQQIPADRDFKLSWTPQISAAPVAAIFRQDKKMPANTESFASIMVMPPQQIYSDVIRSREVMFVIDTSSSMGGNSIRQARSMLSIGIERLSPVDFFNVIEFNSSSRKLFNRAVAATEQNKAQAKSWVQDLTANGGTEILGALMTALEDKSSDDQPQDNKLRQIVFITDGSVGNENEIFRYLTDHIGSSRLFTVGIGAAPNTWFMRKSAELGRGTYTSIANTSELAQKALTLLAKLEQPAITDVKIHFNTANPAEVYPAILPDVYMGEPVLADARWTDKVTDGNIEITGTFAGQTWTQSIKLGSLNYQTTGTDKTASNDQQGLDKLWAGRKIEALEDSLLINNDIDEVERAITEIALAYSMVTKYTSLVAVEDKVSRDTATKNIKTAAVPQAAPARNTMHYPQGSLGTTLRLFLAVLFALLALMLALYPALVAALIASPAKALAKRRIDTSIVCTPLKSNSRKC